jgi:two-component system KDP operon response regulator KdpE
VIEKRTILLVDDEPQIRRVLRTSLTAQGANVLDVQSGEEALELLREHTVDLILLDLNMPGMGGLDTCRAIRSGWDVPIIVVSVRESDRDKVEALDAGADDFVTKPFSFDELMAPRCAVPGLPPIRRRSTSRRRGWRSISPSAA